MKEYKFKHDNGDEITIRAGNYEAAMYKLVVDCKHPSEWELVDDKLSLCEHANHVDTSNPNVGEGPYVNLLDPDERHWEDEDKYHQY
jgi:hypothetical protein